MTSIGPSESPAGSLMIGDRTGDGAVSSMTMSGTLSVSLSGPQPGLRVTLTAGGSSGVVTPSRRSLASQVRSAEPVFPMVIGTVVVAPKSTVSMISVGVDRGDRGVEREVDRELLAIDDGRRAGGGFVRTFEAVSV